MVQYGVIVNILANGFGIGYCRFLLVKKIFVLAACYRPGLNF